MNNLQRVSVAVATKLFHSEIYVPEAMFLKAERERDEARAEIALMRPVVQAACAIEPTISDRWTWPSFDRLRDAVKAYQTGTGTEVTG